MFSALALSITCLLGTETSTKLVWHVTYREALGEARRVSKPLFILFSAGSSTAVRRIGDTPVLSDEIEKALHAGYVRMYVDTETESGKSMADEFGVSSVPTIVLMERGSNRQLHRTSGTPTTAQLLAILSRYSVPSYDQTPEIEPSDQNSTGYTAARTATRPQPVPASTLAAPAWWCRT